MKMLIAYMEGDSSKLNVKGSTLTWHKTVKIPEFVSTKNRTWYKIVLTTLIQTCCNKFENLRTQCCNNIVIS